MISYDEFITNKWKVNAVGDWTKLGVTVYRNGGFLFTRYADWYNVTMGDLISIIKRAVMITFTHKAYSNMYSPKYKRTLNNWILNDRT